MSDVWQNLSTKTTSNKYAPGDINALMADLRIIKGGTAGTTPSTTLEDLATTVASALLSPKAAMILGHGNAGRSWGDYTWKDADEIILRRKPAANYDPFIGAIMNDGSDYTMLSKTDADLTYKYDVPASGGNILDGITAKIANSWNILWLYEKSDGTLGLGSTMMPVTTFSTNNPTNSLTLNQVNSQDIGLLFSEDADLLIWNSSSKLETWLFNSTGGHTPAGSCNVSSRTGTVLTLDGNLSVANFSSGDYVIQLNNFMPLDVSTGNICSEIGSRPYVDTGIRFRTDGSGDIIEFSTDGDKFELNDYQSFIDVITSSADVYRLSYSPVDKTPLIQYATDQNNDDCEFYVTAYWGSNEITRIEGNDRNTQMPYLENQAFHGLVRMREGTSDTGQYRDVGYKI